MDIRIGTSGFSFDDWRRVFYPLGLDKGKFLDYYARYFSTVEINSTYYSTPHPAVMYNLVKKVPRDFDFMVKVPRSLTHRRTDTAEETTAFIDAIEPIHSVGKLSGLLAQFPYSFKFSEANLDYLSTCRNALQPHNLYVEFRHGSWANNRTLRRMQTNGIGYVSVDEPQLHGLLRPDLHVTRDVGYLRLHGRNAEHWWGGGPKRYDYSYSPSDLQSWLIKIDRLKERIRALYVYFNNCYDGQAVVNAQVFQQLVSGISF